MTYKRGFSLVEAAIVLGLVGLVIGGIWIAAASVAYNHKISVTVSAIVSTYGNARQAYYRMPPPAAYTYGVPDALKQSLLPPTFWQNAQCVTPFGTSCEIGIDNGHPVGRWRLVFSIYYSSPGVCIDLVRKVMTHALLMAGGSSFSSGLSTQVGFRPSDIWPSITSGSAAASAAETYCPANTGLIFAFYLD